MSDAVAEYDAVAEQLARKVHLCLREDDLDPRQVVAPACELLDWFLRGDAIVEVVGRNPAEVPPAEMAALARHVLDEAGFDAGFDPGFDLAPERMETLRTALSIMVRDLTTHGIEGEPEIEILEESSPVGAGVRLADGRLLNWGNPVLPTKCDDRPLRWPVWRF
ncbi:hypothetical protein [Streptomyces sp. NPDC088766]|uniref:hypothetical protein n=1 Tax=Streptomyces sp. NPDC088766 TaxID=3365893 RepID=UPI0037FC4EDB